MLNSQLIRIFAGMNEMKWTENVVLADADYVDSVAFDLICNFERMLERRIPQADLAKWIDCVALDGGLRNGNHETLVALLHDKHRPKLDNFVPSSYEGDINGMAFKDNLGEFTMSALPVEELTTKSAFFIETLQLVCVQKDVKRLMLIPDPAIYDDVRHALRGIDDDERRITLFAMQPMPNWNFRQEILGYSLLAALGISSEEINSKS